MNGGAAFARTLSAEERKAHEMRGLGPAPYGYEGMTLRDYFAAAALQGIIAATCNKMVRKAINFNAEERGISSSEQMAGRAFDFADDMLKARGE